MMNAERFRQALDSYGGEPARWPAEQRAEMLDFLDREPEARSWLREARSLDLRLDDFNPDVPDLGERIMAALPRSFVDRLLDWLRPSVPADWWRPALAGSLPLVLGVAIGIGGAGGTTEDYDWALQEQALMMAPAGDWYE